ncbi:MAG TPA: hypothetical protein VNZ52_14900, partial [Candidatus Thermoplasmatota archaeon]|nr:hypothetical protein [Candidatus Thermoplasmatota archaeon]
VNVTLLLAACVTLVLGAVYLYVGRCIGTREPATAGAKRAMGFFALWWYAVAANVALGGLVYAAAALGFASLTVQLTYAHLSRVLLVLSLVGLMYYLLYLVTGKGRLPLVIAYYAAYYGLLLYMLVASAPDAVQVGNWRTVEVPSRPLPRVFSAVSSAALLLPPVLGALAAFRVFFVVEDRSQRYRIALVSWSIVVWWLIAVVAGQREAVGVEWFQMVNRAVSVVAAVGILFAYLPPTFVRERWGIKAFA